MHNSSNIFYEILSRPHILLCFVKEGNKNLQKPWISSSVRRPFLTGLALGLVLLLLPLTTLGQPKDGWVTLLPPSPTPVTESIPPSSQWDSAQTIRVLMGDGSVESMTMADYLWRVVAAEMPASFEPEALRAQSVCARTYSLWKLSAHSHEAEGADICADSSCCQAYTTPEEAATRWGETAKPYTAKLAEAVADTDGQIMTYGGAPIQAVFFSSASGATENAEAVWGRSLPYLVSVDSPEGDEVPNYHSTTTLSADQMRALVEKAAIGADLSADPSGWLTNLVRTSSGRVASIDVGGVTLSGGAARSLFQLRSACFTVTQENGVFTFSVTGYGHGVGLSQYGANAMARSGSTWQDILSHYYTGVTLQTGL